MEIQLIFKISYDPDKDGSLSEFRRKKYQPFKDHIDRLQVAGTLPRGPVKYAVERKQPTRPDGPGPVADVVRGVFLPQVAHLAGTPLSLPPGRLVMDPERIAV